MIRIFKLMIITAALMLLFAAPVLAADIAVIVNKDNTNSIGKDMVERIYRGDVTSWPGGGVIVPLDMPESSGDREAFTSSLLGMSVSKLKASWAVKLFSGKATPPKTVGSDDEMIRAVAGNKNAIGYVSASSVTGSVKVVLTLR